MAESKKSLRRIKIKKSIRKKITGTSSSPRLTVFRSNKGIYCQIIDDTTGVTLVSSSYDDLEGFKGPKTEQSKQVGLLLAKKSLEKGIAACVFDRNGYLYHGRVKALAEGAREGGLKF